MATATTTEATEVTTTTKTSEPTNLKLLVGMAAIPIVAWLLAGAVAYSPWAPGLLQWIIIIVSLLVQVVFLIHTGHEENLPAVYIIAALIGCTFTTVAVLLLPGWKTCARALFWCLSGLYLGMIGEAMTGRVAALAERLSAYEFSQASWVRLPATSPDEESATTTQQGNGRMGTETV
ncbi:hypothetical protein CSOJ01_03954 [Colletotrichum sojae]|uniref:Uncharacterized protein n=1 Tax=Colletotrichum sojae TaxID=2175907 RepID=A0A8H6JL66_9PEZI|nr:hypothetical protein CSOJ01_03954 [Colletotrichum sojae]